MIKLLVILAIVGQVLAYNPTLHDVAITRQNSPVMYPISKKIDVEKYQCLIGVPYGFGHLIGDEVYFISEGFIYGPWLIVDVEAYRHRGYMEENKLIADIDCPFFSSKKGELLLLEHETRWRVYPSNIDKRVRGTLP